VSARVSGGWQVRGQYQDRLLFEASFKQTGAVVARGQVAACPRRTALVAFEVVKVRCKVGARANRSADTIEAFWHPHSVSYLIDAWLAPVGKAERSDWAGSSATVAEGRHSPLLASKVCPGTIALANSSEALAGRSGQTIGLALDKA